MNRILIFLFCIYAFHFSSAQDNPVIISGSAPEYAGYAIDLYQLLDPFSEEKEIIATLNIDNNGSFKSQIQLESTTLYQADFDTWHAKIYLEPCKNYNLVFPPLNTVSDIQKRNPFFNPEIIFFGLRDAPETDLNRMIQAFEKSYAEQENHFFNEIFYSKSQAAVDSLKNNLIKLFPDSGNRYFEDYKLYRMASAEYALHQGKADDFIQTYFIKKEPNLQLEPYVQLFKQLFTNYFAVTGNSIGGNDFMNLVGRADLDGIESYFITNKGWNKKLSHLVILSSINDAYYQGQFSQSSLLNLLKKIADSDGWDNSEKRIATALLNKLTYLQKGSDAPDLVFTDFNGVEHSLSEFEGQYIYLDFTSVSNPICRQHLDYIKSDMTDISQQVKFIHLIPESEATKKDLIQQQNWPGEFFTVSEKETDKYKVKTYPTAYLISKDGKLLLSPASTPMDGFKNQFTSLLRQQQIEELRNQSR